MEQYTSRNMVVKFIFLFSISLLLFSCSPGRNADNPNNLADISLNTWILDNQELKSILSDYIRALDGHSSRNNSFIEVCYSLMNDSTYIYTLYEGIDINSFIYTPTYTLFQFENRLICFQIYGGITDGLDIFKINDDFLVEFMKKNFPDQYDYYLRAGDFPPPITSRLLQWNLVFQNGELIKKEILE